MIRGNRPLLSQPGEGGKPPPDHSPRFIFRLARAPGQSGMAPTKFSPRPVGKGHHSGARGQGTGISAIVSEIKAMSPIVKEKCKSVGCDPHSKRCSTRPPLPHWLAVNETAAKISSGNMLVSETLPEHQQIGATKKVGKCLRDCSSGTMVCVIKTREGGSQTSISQIVET